MNQTIQETIKDTDEPVTVKGFRSASGETPNLGLPIVSGTDVYSPLTDWNQSMEKIDSAVGLVELMGSVNKIEIEKIKADNTRQDAELDAIRQVDETQTEWLVDQQGSINKLKVSNDTIEKDIIEQNALIKNLTNRVLEVEDKLDPDSGEVAAKIGEIKADNTRQDAELDAIRQVDETQTEWLVAQQGSINKLKVSNDTIEEDIIKQDALIKNLTDSVLEVEGKLDPDSGEVAAKIEANTASISDLTNRVVEVENKLGPDSGEVAAKIEANTASISDHWQGNETVESSKILNNAKLTKGFASLSGRGGLPIIKKVLCPPSGSIVSVYIPNADLYPPAGAPTGLPNHVLIEIFFKRTDLGANLGEMYGAMVVKRSGLTTTITTRDLSNTTNVTNTFSVDLDKNKIEITPQGNFETDAIYFRVQAINFD